MLIENNWIFNGAIYFCFSLSTTGFGWSGCILVFPKANWFTCRIGRMQTNQVSFGISRKGFDSHHTVQGSAFDFDVFVCKVSIGLAKATLHFTINSVKIQWCWIVDLKKKNVIITEDTSILTDFQNETRNRYWIGMRTMLHENVHLLLLVSRKVHSIFESQCVYCNR